MAENPEPPGKPAVSLTPRRSAGAERPAEPEPGHLEQIASLANSVKLLASQLNAAKPPESAPAPPERVSRQQRKFQRIGFSEPRADAPPPGDLAPAETVHGDTDAADDHPEDPAPASGEISAEQHSIDASARNKNIAWPQRARKGVQSTYSQRRKRRSTLVPMLVLLGCNLFVLVFGFLVGQSASPGANPPKDAKTASAPPTLPADALGPQSVNERTLEIADNALKAEKTGDPNAARRLYNDAIQRRVGLIGAEYRLALLAIQRGDLLDADLHLVHSTAAGEFVAPCDYIRATFAGSQGNFAEAGRQLEAATHAEPFNAKYYFCWAECLRRQGKPHAAEAVLEKALDRGYSPEEGDLYVFKLGLAKIESGPDDDFKASLARHLEKEPVSGDWLLLAAAQDLEHAAYPAAADHLQKASRAMPAAQFESRVQDYLFHGYAKQPEVAPFLDRPITPGKTEAGASVMDPATWSPDRADPGNWPTSPVGH